MPALRMTYLITHAPSSDAAAFRRALQIWEATGTVPVAHIVDEHSAADDESAAFNGPPTAMEALPSAA